jgi:hypothetical protein
VKHQVDSRVLGLIERTRKRALFMRLQGEWLMVSALLPLLVWLFLLLEHFTDHEPGTRTTLQLLLYSFVGLVFLALFALAGWRLYLKKGRMSLRDTALAIGWGSEGVKDRLLNGLQVIERGADGDNGFDPELVAASLDHVVPHLEEVDYRRVLPHGSRKRSLKRAAIVWLVGLCLLLLGREQALLAAGRLLEPRRDFLGAPAFALNLEARYADSLGLGRLVDQQSVDLVIDVSGDVQPAQVLLTAFAGDTLLREWELPVSRGLARFAGFVPGRGFEVLASATERRMDRERLVKSNRLKLEWSATPRITDLVAELSPPAYTRLPARQLASGDALWTVPVGSRIRLDLKSDKALLSARIEAEKANGDSLEIPLDSLGSQRAGITLRARQDLNFALCITDSESLENPKPLWRRLRVIQDEVPRLRVLRPREVEGRLDQGLELPLAALAEDDYGFSACRLAMRRVSGRFGEPDTPDPQQVESLSAGWVWQDLNLSPLPDPEGRGRRHAGVESLISLLQLDLLPDDEAQFFVELWDNNGWNGPRRVTSALYRWTLPGMDDLFAEAEAGQEELAEESSQLLDRARENQQRLKELNEEMRRDPEITWEKEQKLKQVLSEQQEIVQEAAQLAEKLEELQQKAERNQLISPELQEKMARLKELLNEAISPELLEQLKKAAEEAMKPESQAGQKPRQDMEEALKKMEEQLDRFLAVLEEMRLEQKLEELARRAEALLENQRQLHQQLNQTNEEERLARQQDTQRQEAESLANEIEQLQQDFAEKSTLPKEQLESSQQLMEERRIAPRMGEFSEQMQQSSSPEKAEQEKLDQDLNELAAMLQQSLEEMRQQQKDELGRELDALAQALLLLSLSQEEIDHSSNGLSVRSPLVPELAERSLEIQLGLRAGAEQAWQLSRKSFHVPKALLPELGHADRKLDQILDDFHERRLGQMKGLGPEVMAHLNRSVLLLKEAGRQMQQGSSSSGFEEMMEKLSQASAKQQCLNGQCNNLMAMKPGQSQKPLSISFSEASQQQAGIRQDLESLQEKLGEEGKPTLGDMGQVAADMKEVEQDLESRSYTERTQRLQERILSRLLDAQRSVRRQDEEKKRESRSASSLKALSGDELPAEEENVMRQELLKALEEGFTPESRELIRRYLQELEEVNSESP